MNEERVKQSLNTIPEQNVNLSLKKCRKCLQMKELWEFPTNINKCKPCYNKQFAVKTRHMGHARGVDVGFSFYHKKGKHMVKKL